MTDREALRRGEVVLLCTDSLPGLHLRADLPGAADRLGAVKGSPPGRPFLLLFSSVEEALRQGSCATAEQAAELGRAWPGPLTALLRPRSHTPPAWIHAAGTIALRVPAHPALRKLLSELGFPLFSTSANRAGEEPATSLDEARSRFPDLPVLELPGRAEGLPSTLVDLTTPTARILRPGAAPWPPRAAP